MQLELPKLYDPRPVEQKWYPHWLEKGYFKASPNPDKQPYTIVIPPPNVTGVLHMGHMLNNTIQDVLIRRARMAGMEACWVPGTDHASIATEAKVVQLLREQGIKKSDLTREAFLEHAWAWKEKYGGIILKQLEKLGASCDWDRTRFTMEPDMSEAVTDVFVRLHEKGLIYRAPRMVNWDPVARTTVSDEEVLMKEENSKLYYVRYAIEDTGYWILDTGENQKSSNNRVPDLQYPVSSIQYLTVATTRPETILVDVAIAVNPADERYKDLIGKRVRVPLHPEGKTIPIIADEAILIDFGTGCLKVTPAHDTVDYEIAQRNPELEVLDILNEDGTLNQLGFGYEGMDRFAARKAFARDLEAAGLLEKAEDYVNKVGRSERTDAVIEPRLSLQWFVKMKDLAGPAQEAVRSGKIKIHPDKYENTYNYWLDNVRDWCISRQLWWGQRIPAWYLPDGRVIVAPNVKLALRKARQEFMLYALSEVDLRQEEDVVDTWFSSWLWPLSVFDHFKRPGNPDISYFYPTNTLVTAPEILFFWVARMVMAGLEFHGEVPFTDVYLTGIVRDKQGRKMSKSLGNSPNPLDLIEKFGADGVRFGMLVSSPAGNDLLFDEKYCEQGRNFSNKIWNAFRLVSYWPEAEGGYHNPAAITWFEHRLGQVITEVNNLIERYRLSEALQAIYKLIWDDFCSWYLEMAKPPYGEPASPEIKGWSVAYLDALMRLLHPFMPFITEEVWQHLAQRGEEEVWQHLAQRGEDESICIAPWLEGGVPDETLLAQAGQAFELVTAVRNMRNARGLSPKQLLEVRVKTATPAAYQAYEQTVLKLAGLERLAFVTEKPAGLSDMALIGTDEVYVLLEGGVDTEALKAEAQKEIEYLRGFLQSVEVKLSNERFVANAKPEVIEKERQKKADAEAKIGSLTLILNT